MTTSYSPSLALARKLIDAQFPQYRELLLSDIEKQGHDNRTYKLGSEILIRMPTAESYALKVPKEQSLLPELAKRLKLPIPAPIAMGYPSEDYPYHFSLYRWLGGKSLNLITLNTFEQEQLATDLSNFLKALQAIDDLDGPQPGQHNWYRGDHISVYDKGAREQIETLKEVIDSKQALYLWNEASKTKWQHNPVWIHGDLAVGNLLIDQGKLSAVIDFGGMALGDPACDLVMSWTYFQGKARDIFMNHMLMDSDTWLRARAWALWKATYELCQIEDKDTPAACIQKAIIQDVLSSCR